MDLESLQEEIAQTYLQLNSNGQRRIDDESQTGNNPIQREEEFPTEKPSLSDTETNSHDPSHHRKKYVDTFRELIIGYTRTYRAEDEYGTLTGETQTEWVAMDKPRICGYQKTTITGRVVSKPIRLGSSLCLPTTDFDSILSSTNPAHQFSRDVSDKSIGKLRSLWAHQKTGARSISVSLGQVNRSNVRTIPKVEER